MDVYIDSAEQSPDAYHVAHQPAVADQDADSLRQARVTTQRDRILAALGTMITVDERVKIAVTAWLTFTHTAILEWLDNRTITRDQLRDLCADVLWAVVGLIPADQLRAVRKHPLRR